MTTSQDLLELVVAAILGPNAAAQPATFATDAQDRVYAPGDWSTQDGQYPIIKLRVPQESKQSLGRSGPPEFLVLTTIRIVGEVSAPADVNDAGASAAQTALWQLQRQIEIAVVGSYPLTRQIQQIVSINSQLSYNSDAETHLAGIQIDLVLEFIQGPDDFAPVDAEDLDIVTGEFPDFPPVGFELDNLQQ